MEVFAHPTRPDYVVLRIAQCPRMFQMLTSTTFGHVIKHEPEWNGFVMTRATYESMHKHLTRAASLLDLKQPTTHPITNPDRPPPSAPRPSPPPPVWTRSVWTQTETNLNTDATQTDADLILPPPPPPPPPPLVESHPHPNPDANIEQWKREIPPMEIHRDSSVHSSMSSKPHGSSGMAESKANNNNNNGPPSSSSALEAPIESGLLRTTLPMFPDENVRQHTKHAPIDPEPVSSVHDTRQTVFSGFNNFQEVYAHRQQMGLFLWDDR